MVDLATVGPVGIVSGVLLLLIVFLYLGDKVSLRIHRMLNRLSMVFFRRFVSPNFDRQRRVEAAYLETTYRNYAAKTLLFAAMAFLGGAILGAFIITLALVFLEPIVEVLAELPDELTSPLGITDDFEFDFTAEVQWILLISLGAIIFGSLSSGLSYGIRWWLPSSAAEVRRRSIDEGLTRTTAFMYALSRGGMEFPQILRTLTAHKEIYGETANEMSVAVREMDMFGRDMITALRRMSSRTPSEDFKTFSENLTSVLQSGGDLSEFLHEQFRRFRNESEERQQDLLELLSTIAEAYVTLLVAGMLFFITILLIFGLTLSDTLLYLQLTVYVLIPVGNALFALLLQQQLDTFGISGVGGRGGLAALQKRDLSSPTSVLPPSDGAAQSESVAQPDGGVVGPYEQENRRMLSVYDRLHKIKYALQNPVEIIFWNPTKILWISVPIALLMFGIRFPEVIAADGINERVLDDLLVQSVLFVIATYAIVRYVHKRHITKIERATPEFLERLASLNEAGMSVVQAIDRVRGTDLSVLTPEIDRIWRDMQYGSTVDDSFIRFGRRVRTKAIARVVTLLTNAMRASGNMGPVIRIAAEQHRAELSLRRQRRQQMFTYLVVIYIAFFVFLVIILAINEMLVPNIPETSPVDTSELGAVGAGGFGGIADFGGVDQTAYTLVFFHAALIQAVCAGFIAGQLGEGSVRDGAKHAAIMLTLAYLVFIFFTSPIASIVAGDVEGEDFEVVIDGEQLTNLEEVSLSEGGFLAAYGQEDGINGTKLGHSEYLPPGSHSDVRIPIDSDALEEVKDQQNADDGDEIRVRLVPHKDTNGNERFDFEQPYLPGEDQVDKPYGTPSAGGSPGLDVTAILDDSFTII